MGSSQFVEKGDHGGPSAAAEPHVARRRTEHTFFVKLSVSRVWRKRRASRGAASGARGNSASRAKRRQRPQRAAGAQRRRLQDLPHWRTLRRKEHRLVSADAPLAISWISNIYCSRGCHPAFQRRIFL